MIPFTAISASQQNEITKAGLTVAHELGLTDVQLTLSQSFA